MAATDLSTEFVGRRDRVFRMSLVMGIVTVLTVGFYRFWMKTRLRRYYWSSIRPGGQPLEYVGDPLEKLLGFFIAVVILAFYIGIVNLILMFLSFSLFEGNTVAYLASGAGVIPIWFYAQYRARRYVYARTRWRGLRFGVDPGAWGYAWRALVHWAITIVSLGLLWPRMNFWLEKYKWDRTWFGDRQFHQGGKWTMLLKGFVPFLIVIAALISWVAWSFFTAPDEIYSDEFFAKFEFYVFTIAPVTLLASPLLAIAWAWYKVRSFRVLTDSKTAGPVRFISEARTPRVIGIYVGGYFLTSFITGLVASAVGAIYGAMMIAALGESFSLDTLENLENIENIAGPGWQIQVAGLAIYFLVFVAWATFRHMFVTLPLWQHYAETLRIVGSESIHEIEQRERDEHREAEGFAEALDLGAAI